jgi:hypothetical protein
VVELDKFSLIEEIGFQTRVEEYSNLDDVWGVHSHLLPNELVSVSKTHKKLKPELSKKEKLYLNNCGYLASSSRCVNECF